MFLFKRVLLISFFLTTSLLSSNYSEDLLKIHANILPKMVLMDYNFKEKTVNNKIVITVLHQKSDSSFADFIKDQIGKKYQKGIMNHEIVVKTVTCTEFLKKSEKSTVVYLLRLDFQKCLKKIDKALQSNVITFSYDKNYLTFGINLSIIIGKKVQPIINISSLKKNNISFHPTMTSISKIYSE